MNDDEVILIDGYKNGVLKRVVKLVKKVTNAYFLVVCVLFILLGVLCYNNITLYHKYKNTQQQNKEVLDCVQAIKSDKQELNIEKEKLHKQKDELIKKCADIEAKNDEISKSILDIRRMNDELIKRNKELLDDNVALQNTLKMAASVGVKPQKFTRFTGLSSRGEINRGMYLGKFTVTAYTPSKKECGNNNGITNSGKPIIPGVSLAVDGKHWSFGTVFYIRGLGYAIAMDTGSAIKGRQRFDFAVFDKKFANKLGKRKWDVYLVKIGNGNVGEINGII